jgi:quercetin dioxygenase-like cupin family protein
MKRAPLTAKVVAAVIAGATLGVIARGQTPVERPMKDVEQTHVLVTPADLEWKAAPSALPVGARMAVLKGDPEKEGLFTLRLRFPPGYRIPPHWHAADEHVTVMSGSFHVGTGREFDTEVGKRLPPGSFAALPAKTPHFAWTDEEEAIIQLHGMGPWKIHFLEPTGAREGD